MNPPRQTFINASFGHVEAGANVTQIYSVGAKELEASVFRKSPTLTDFSPEWLLFHEEKAPLIARGDELAALHNFINDDRPFLWWAMHGPAGIGKSRLAHAFISSLSEDWDGGFLAKDRVTVGGASAWEPHMPTFWVVDYAAAYSEVLSDFLCVLARRFANSPFKIRILLLEREAGATSSWWRALMQNAGSAQPLMHHTLYAHSWELAPLAQHSQELLHALLVRAGHTEESAAQRISGLGLDKLNSMTDAGRPLLVALAAATIVEQSDAQVTEVKLPQNLLDWYLGRELRLWREKAADAEQFDAICYILFLTTLLGGLYLVGPNDTVHFQHPDGRPVNLSPEEQKRRVEELNYTRLKKLSSSVEYPDVRSCLSVIEQIGISTGNGWHLQPDMLGERLIQILLHPPLYGNEYLFNLPKFDERRLASAAMGAYEFSQGTWGALYRLDDRSIAKILALSGEYKNQTMRFVLIALRRIAEQRDQPLPAEAVKSIFVAAHFPDKFIPEIPRVIDVLYKFASETDFTSSRGRKLVDIFEQTVKRDVFSKVGVWLTPFMLIIANIKTPGLYKLAELYTKRIKHYKFTRTREVVLGLRLLHHVSSHIIAVFKDRVSTESEAGVLILAHLAQKLFPLYDKLAAAAAAVLKKAHPEDAKEMNSRIVETSVQFSYILLSSAVILKEEPSGNGNRFAQSVSANGLRWSMNRKNSRNHFLLMRNYLAASLVKLPHEQTALDLRKEFLDNLRSGEKRREFIEIVTDGFRIAANSCDAVSFARVLEIVKGNAAWIGDEMYRFDEEGLFYSNGIERGLKNRQIPDAIALLKNYGDLVFLRDRALDDIWLAHTTSDVLISSMQYSQKCFEEVMEWLVETLNSVSSPDVAQFCGQSICFALLAARESGHKIELREIQFSSIEANVKVVSSLIDADEVNERILGKVSRLLIGEIEVKRPGRPELLMYMRPLVIVDTETAVYDDEPAIDAFEPKLISALLDQRRIAGSFAAFSELLSPGPRQ